MCALFNRGSSVPENDRLASIAAELQFRSLSRHSSPTEEREGELHLDCDIMLQSVCILFLKTIILLQNKSLQNVLCGLPKCMWRTCSLGSELITTPMYRMKLSILGLLF